ncbi:DNA/RNA nuclease SfsA [Methanohalophilus portucalensis]|uniref:Sugar fermentation stimulation protein homolog n=2 Tax=Methanohalophilus portucalensis TaxID=39664 RepID=A0A1L9C3R4_9EURY|nr:DNA/RNA nuclease SfsA [Methanohalophilus portucalensis]ATU09239.1 sugar fermentation stimulation protein SfsA [Methanohalophilus portucalensis]OJH49172.1 sugar fermentation stimulation protein [Methanohalophilus portucalensis FDF-1]RNI11752.1 DNA/RNA nuclease SfsA [Methanohalophilus portucalensis FDF-1]SMH42671.1 sugar fermentation stimulation protein A [Methanohalophilus portucalensis FDF-1]
MPESEKQVMHIGWDAEAVFISRPNRFVAIVDIPSSGIQNVEVHVHDPGRLVDLLYRENRLLLKKATNPHRKTKWDLIAAKKDDGWVLVNSAYHRKIAEWVLSDPDISPLGQVDSILPEQKLGESRLDFLVFKGDKRIWVEIKGCTLVRDEVALFPDAPTTRGKRHLDELTLAKRNRDHAAVLFLVFRPDAKYFSPNRLMDPGFYGAYQKAREAGVDFYPLLFTFREGIIYFYKILSSHEI